ncbi:hypothetical protein GLW04_19540 [Halobacillus litoralis]|uniref:Uncharacterized protein n=1 Tax=Halobacillus litoralis TaxID=45668 RepID=A0A845DWM4_9BACI|nr:hypothetical protein [Halobacillus litoralis]MYL22071.1 hypothetical protein [Halobacillus litoralis]MYL25158.1 hypothetical protein [Halomonas alkaliantarctica]
MKPDLSSMSREELERLAALSLTNDPLFQHNKPERAYEPSMADVIHYLDIEGLDYKPGITSREKISLSLSSDTVAAVKTFAANHDLAVSAAADLLFRVALGDYDEWWHYNGAKDEEKKS